MYALQYYIYSVHTETRDILCACTYLPLFGGKYEPFGRCLVVGVARDRLALTQAYFQALPLYV